MTGMATTPHSPRPFCKTMVECSCGIIFSGDDPAGRQAAHAAGLLPDLDDLAGLLGEVVQQGSWAEPES